LNELFPILFPSGIYGGEAVVLSGRAG